jgi:hypothetical protein
VKNNFLASFPSKEVIVRIGGSSSLFVRVVVNGHIHTPYSFSAFDNIESVFEMAEGEGVNVLGINDFYVTDGYEAFHDGCIAKGIFPLFNIEFIGLMKDEQKAGIRINDPNNPGRIYFCGKGLDYPFHLDQKNMQVLLKVKEETQNQLRAMVDKLNILIAANHPSLRLSFDSIKAKYARELVRERHIARALREMALENFQSQAERVGFIESLYGEKKSRSGFDNTASLENEIRSNILKAGGTAFVEEDENSFLMIENITGMINNAGGIPCYPVLLDDPSGKCTEFESDPEQLHKSLSRLGIGCIELIPGRNDHDILEKFVSFFNEKGYIITFGTEHNTPEMIPLTVTARGNRTLSNYLKQTSSEGAGIIAAHQYLRSRGEAGYIDNNGRPRMAEKEYFEKLGRSVIEYFLRNR